MGDVLSLLDALFSLASRFCQHKDRNSTLIAEYCFTAFGSPRPHLEATKCFGANLSSLAGFDTGEVLALVGVLAVTSENCVARSCWFAA